METRGVLRARRRGIGALSRNSNSGPPRRNGGTSADRAMATSHLLGPWVSIGHSARKSGVVERQRTILRAC